MPGGLDEAAADANAYLSRLADGPALKLVAWVLVPISCQSCPDSDGFGRMAL